MKSSDSRLRTPSVTDLTAERDDLVRRLEDGDRKIADARQRGSDITRLETHWIRLLRDYEATCAAIANGATHDLPEAA